VQGGLGRGCVIGRVRGQDSRKEGRTRDEEKAREVIKKERA
jgi:hypothetical protein